MFERMHEGDTRAMQLTITRVQIQYCAVLSPRRFELRQPWEPTVYWIV